MKSQEVTANWRWCSKECFIGIRWVQNMTSPSSVTDTEFWCRG